VCFFGYIILLTVWVAGGERDVAQPAHSIGGMRAGDRWWRGDGASPQGSVGGFITPCAVQVLYFSQQECAGSTMKHIGDMCGSSSDTGYPLLLPLALFKHSDYLFYLLFSHTNIFSYLTS